MGFESENEILLQDIINAFYQQADSELYPEMLSQSRPIQELITRLINNFEFFATEEKILSSLGSSGGKTPLSFLNKKRDMIYQDFFQLQNLMNAFLGQAIIVSYVQTDPISGKKEIRLINNDISHIQASEQINPYSGKSWNALVYEVNSHYEILKNSLTDQENQGLEIAAAEVEARYARYKHRILWKVNNNWYGYKLSNRGVINEAYVAFYIHEIQLKNTLEYNINDFMTMNEYGVIFADNANGFLIGDTSLGGLQFAVKGSGGGPQKYITIINALKKIRDLGFSQQAFAEFITRFKEVEKQKATSLVKPLTQRSIEGMVRYHGDKLIEPLSFLGQSKI